MEKGRLCLTRREDEVVMIGDDVAIKIDKIQGGTVHLSIVAPKCLTVHRLEIWQKIQEENNAE